jgi:hypothetical protein
VNEEVIIDWVFMSLPALIFWLYGYLDHRRVSQVVPGKVTSCAFLVGDAGWEEGEQPGRNTGVLSGKYGRGLCFY